MRKALWRCGAARQSIRVEGEGYGAIIEVGKDVFDDALDEDAVTVFRDPADVRRENDIRQAPQGMARRQRLLHENIERRTPQPSVLQHLDQRPFVHERGASGVDE